MPKPTNAKAPPLPTEQAVKQARGKLMRKKSDNMLAAETGRRNTQEIRADWARSVKGRGKGRGKGKKGGKKGGGKGKYVEKKSTEESRQEAVDKLEKRMEKKHRDSISEMVKIDKMLAPKKARFKKVSTIKPEFKGLNLMLKCVKCDKVDGATDTWEAVCGDDSGVVTFSLKSQEHADLCKPGASLRVQNAKVVMMKNFIRVVVDKWAIMKAADSAHDFEPKKDNDVSATEYELTA